MRLQTRLMPFRATLPPRRANRGRRRPIEADLATYPTEADLNDPHALPETCPDGPTHELRQFLSRQRVRRSFRA
jgi:hypothetical protein